MEPRVHTRGAGVIGVALAIAVAVVIGVTAWTTRSPSLPMGAGSAGQAEQSPGLAAGPLPAGTLAESYAPVIDRVAPAVVTILAERAVSTRPSQLRGS
jgi:S1-C subfamily serine protease